MHMKPEHPPLDIDPTQALRRAVARKDLADDEGPISGYWDRERRSKSPWHERAYLALHAARTADPEGRWWAIDLKPEGSGHNTSLVDVAHWYRFLSLSEDMATEALLEHYSRKKTDVDRAIRRVYDSGDGTFKPSPQFPDLDQEKVDRIADVSVDELLLLSPAPIDTSPRDIIAELFKEGDLVCLGSGVPHPHAIRVAHIHEFSEGQLEQATFIIPAAMRGRDAVDNAGGDGRSLNSQANILSRRFQVVEFDTLSKERSAGVLMLLAKYAPLRMVVDSGNKSVHGWYDLGGVTDAQRLLFLQRACSLGADPRLNSKNQWVRMPGGPNPKTGRRQQVLYLNLNRGDDPEMGDAGEAPAEMDIAGIEDETRNEIPTIYSMGASFIWKDGGGVYRALSKDHASRMLHMRGCSKKGDKGMPCEIDRILAEASQDRSIDYLGQAAGVARGPHVLTDGRRVVISRDPQLPVPAEGDHEFILRFIRSLCGDDSDNVLLWIKSHYSKLERALRGVDVSEDKSTQVLTLAGGAGNGKSVLARVIKDTFGGREAKGVLYFARGNAFNGELASAETIVLDEPGEIDADGVERIKDTITNPDSNIHPKNKQAFTLPLVQAIVITVNDSDERVALLPDVADPAIGDKFILVKTQDARLEDEAAGKFKRLKSQIPAFLHWLLNEFEEPGCTCSAPKDGRCWRKRYGACACHSAELLGQRRELTGEADYWATIQEGLRIGDDGKPSPAAAISGPAREIARTLGARGKMPMLQGQQARALGVLLGQLRSSYPDLIVREMGRSNTIIWTINPDTQ
jgi:hypothetical protein